MELDYFLPRADLRDFVRAYYYFSADNLSVQPMCAELGNIRVLLNGSGRVRFSNGRKIEVPNAFLIGPTNGAYVMEVEAGTRVFGIGIRPRGWGALLGVNAAETADQIYDLSDFSGRLGRRLVEEIGNAPDLPAMASAADRYFADLFVARTRRSVAYPEALEKWLTNPGDLDIDRLMEMIDISRRQTDRISKQFFGASPKLLQRKYRALRAADRIRAGQTLWVSAAGDGFYDQSHFIKDFKSFIGVTPRQFAAAEATWITEVQARRLAAPLHHPLASI